MAKCAAAWLPCWKIRHHARSRAPVLHSGSTTPRHYRILSEHGNVGAVGEFPKCRGQRPRLQARFGSGNFSIISCVPKKATTKNGTMFAIIQSGPTWRKAPPNGHSLEKLRRFVSNNLCNSRECRPRVAGFARLTKFGQEP